MWVCWNRLKATKILENSQYSKLEKKIFYLLNKNTLFKIKTLAKITFEAIKKRCNRTDYWISNIEGRDTFIEFRRISKKDTENVNEGSRHERSIIEASAMNNKSSQSTKRKGEKQ